MKAISLCLALGVAQFAMCAPAPRNSEGQVDEASARRHDASTPPKAWLHYDNQDDEPVPDRRHSSRLPRPKMSRPDHLPPLSRHRIKIDVIRVPHAANDENENDDFELVDVDIAGPPHPGMPCHRHHCHRHRHPHPHGGWHSHERNDMLIVYLAVAFTLGVVAMETWGSVFRRWVALTSRLQWSVQCPVNVILDIGRTWFSRSQWTSGGSDSPQTINNTPVCTRQPRKGQCHWHSVRLVRPFPAKKCLQYSVTPSNLSRRWSSSLPPQRFTRPCLLPAMQKHAEQG
ncbi:hypothetical protein C8A01DRAFT_14212 [Parachaetomium inaequale]|uniref:Uncharacterized protein n=1 Tax=Parachaetomium inaequale TaxID=2588326 RepID=A0AAN6PJW4_9PEZI|nr:hypothetical protein C8A01DRAFT_14212 [Parachaetomium inaequale]